ncbi:DEAD/DEAH box helicase [Pedobacter agri]|uniref:DEAD/DEAH box helicase family protein n=1 Tax=Pedobacter agri TaxID=454586 RepID=A0A9X3D9Y6_9SPHI|nr:DEAD/DEAH box helicase family protein [Pedobacter agri]MCX3263708.1 DEAD/DEAH box helicase family protein [Pedobacter agri]
MQDKEGRILAVNQLKLWDHQKDALKDIIDYINAFDIKSFLVKMPTGTGKTGVFSALSRVAYPDLNFLIITPSTALKFQILKEVQEKFWNKIAKPISELPDQVVEPLLPKDAVEVISKIEGKKSIIVTTIQALQYISANDSVSFEAIKKNTDCIIFDEGHKEPAYTWGETVRSFRKPTVLFSATPYRNDYKIFNVDKEKFFSLDHSKCEQAKILRALEIQQLDLSTLNPSTFVNAVLAKLLVVIQILNGQGIAQPRTIIRCENQSDIEKIVASLKKLKKRAVGIHQNFKDKNDLLSEVPDTAGQQKYDFFVHQFKLVEGIDNPEFSIVALYAPFKSSRLLIQQIGRVLRNPELQPDRSAYLFGLDAQGLKKEWKSYLDYDKMVDKRKKLYDITDVLKVNKEASTLYFDGSFRELVNVSEISLSKSILFQKKVNAYFHDGSLIFNELSENLLEEWGRRDYSILKHELTSPNCLIILYIKYENSPLVKDGVFIEQKLAATMLRMDKSHIFYYDSEQNNPMRQIEDLAPVSRENLVKLFKNKRNISKVFLINTDIGSRNIRSKEIQSNSIEATAPGLSDHSYFPARIEGKVREKGETKRRYLGFQNGRITDATGKRIPFDELQLWIDEVDQELRTVIPSSSINTFMARFAERVDPPATVEGICILLDIDGEDLDNFRFGEDSKPVYFDDLCANIENNAFTLIINDQAFDFVISYASDTKRFNLFSAGIDEFVSSRYENEEGILAFFNTNQSFRIVLKGNEYVYAGKFFFRPGANLISKKKDLDLNQIFSPHPCISKIISEKGNIATLPITSNLWHKDTLFGLIARQASGYGDNPLENAFDFEHLLCDDLQGEIGDFIALDTQKKRVVFIHAKAGDSGLSATAFQEVCGQATKNLDYLTPYFDKKPTANIAKWTNPWAYSKVGTVSSRIIKGGLTPKAFYATYEKLVSDPSTSREVWIIVGNMFDYRSFSKEINKRKISEVKPQVIQLVYLLRSTWNNVASVGAQLKIFC